MPKIPTRSTSTIALPDIPGGEVVIYNSLTLGDLASFDTTDEMTDTQKMVNLLPKIILSWNLTDENNNELPITSDNISLFPVSAMEVISAHIEKISEKKETSSDNTPASA